MKTLLSILASAALFCAAAAAEDYTSPTLGFSATFPGVAQTASEQSGSASTVTVVKSEVTGLYTAMVTVEVYKKPTTVSPLSVRAMISAFVAQLDASVTSSKAVTIDGAKGRSFTYRSRDKQQTGSGMVVVTAGAKPRVYQVYTMATSSAVADDLAGLDAFLTSFHIQ